MTHTYIFPLLILSPVQYLFLAFLAIVVVYGVYRLILGLLPTS